jgi:predicted transcriptional regulator
MKSTKDLRAIHWRTIRDHLSRNRKVVHSALERFAPCTATELALRINWDKCSVRPRLTELRELGLAIETGTRRNGEHELKFVPLALAEHKRMVEQQGDPKQEVLAL